MRSEDLDIFLANGNIVSFVKNLFHACVDRRMQTAENRRPLGAGERILRKMQKMMKSFICRRNITSSTVKVTEPIVSIESCTVERYFFCSLAVLQDIV